MIKTTFLSKRFDEAAILTTLAKIAFTPEPSLSDQDYMVLAALRRSSPEWDLSIEETAERLAGYNEEQIVGLTSNVKGILHEMEFQKLENEDGDSVVAALYPDTNHKGVDVQLLDQETGESYSIQLKATDNMSAIRDWMEANPDTEIRVTEELAEKMDLPSSGFSNQELTVRVEDFVDTLIQFHQKEDDSIWDSLPLLLPITIGMVIFELWRRYRNGQINFDQFKWLSMKTIGLKGAKYTAIFTMLSIPGLNVVVGAYLLASLIFSMHGVVAQTKAKSIKPFAFLGKKKLS